MKLISTIIVLLAIVVLLPILYIGFSLFALNIAEREMEVRLGHKHSGEIALNSVLQEIPAIPSSTKVPRGRFLPLILFYPYGEFTNLSRAAADVTYRMDQRMTNEQIFSFYMNKLEEGGWKGNGSPKPEVQSYIKGNIELRINSVCVPPDIYSTEEYRNKNVLESAANGCSGNYQHYIFITLSCDTSGGQTCHSS